jgi:Flp pilus assembly protein TadG
MLIPRIRRLRRRAAAAIEMAVVVPILLTIVIGVWELGRCIQVLTIMENAARDGARIAAQGTIINTTAAYTFIRFHQGSPAAGSPPTPAYPADNPPYVYDAITNSLNGAGITNLTGAQITFQFVQGDTTRVAPYQGLKNERFMITVTVPYANVNWTNLTLFAPTSLTVRVYWQMMVDDPFTVNTSLPGWNPMP